jgi:uncharacterized protein YndB with AHSA1/START domain
MSIDVIIDATIARPIEVVFARLADLDAWPAWLIASGIVSVGRESRAPIVAGEHLTVEQRAAGRAGTFAAVVTALEPPTRLALEGRDGDGVTIEIDASLTPTAEAGATGAALRWTIRIGLPFRYRFFESMARPQVERAAALDIEALRRTLETAED